MRSNCFSIVFDSFQDAVKRCVESGALSVGQLHVSVQQLEVVAPGGVHRAVALHGEAVPAEDHNQDEEDGQVTRYLHVTENVGDSHDVFDNVSFQIFTKIILFHPKNISTSITITTP